MNGKNAFLKKTVQNWLNRKNRRQNNAGGVKKTFKDNSGVALIEIETYTCIRVTVSIEFYDLAVD